MLDDQLQFELPINFVDAEKYRAPSVIGLDVPHVVANHVVGYAGRDTPLDPLNPFFFLKRGDIPVYVLNWFLNQQSRRFSNLTRFYRALHMMEAFRGQHYGIGQGPSSSESQDE